MAIAPAAKTPHRRGRTPYAIGVLALATALVVVLALTNRSGSDTDADAQVSASSTAMSGQRALLSSTNVMPTTIPQATTPAAVAAATTPATTPATTAATTTPATTPATTAPSNPAAIPTVPVMTPTAGAGNAQLLANPLPSGLAWDEVQPALTVAQQLADALANDDWAVARAIDGGSDLTDQQYADGYRYLDRASLMLVDARREGVGVRLLVVSVANERSGGQTSLYCLEWSVDTAAGIVIQHGNVVGLIDRLSYAISPEGVRNEPELDERVRSACGWS